jgi:hypothetical protein
VTAEQRVFPEWRTFPGEVAGSAPVRQVVKRSGEVERYDRTKIEEIRDFVAIALIEAGAAKAAKACILYRARHEAMRDTARLALDIDATMDGYISQADWRVKENANVNYSPGGLIPHNSGAITADYRLRNVYPEEIAAAHKDAGLHIHDLSMFPGYCARWSLRQLIAEGPGGVAGLPVPDPDLQRHEGLRMGFARRRDHQPPADRLPGRRAILLPPLQVGDGGEDSRGDRGPGEGSGGGASGVDLAAVDLKSAPSECGRVAPKVPDAAGRPGRRRG